MLFNARTMGQKGTSQFPKEVLLGIALPTTERSERGLHIEAVHVHILVVVRRRNADKSTRSVCFARVLDPFKRQNRLKSKKADRESLSLCSIYCSSSLLSWCRFSCGTASRKSTGQETTPHLDKNIFKIRPSAEQGRDQ